MFILCDYVNYVYTYVYRASGAQNGQIINVRPTVAVPVAVDPRTSSAMMRGSNMEDEEDESNLGAVSTNVGSP